MSAADLLALERRYQNALVVEFDAYVKSTVAGRHPYRPGNYEWLEQVYPDYVGRNLPTRLLYYASMGPVTLIRFLRRAAKAMLNMQ